jgi:[ribosomal protein S5]-alanine N-acetyltransferase
MPTITDDDLCLTGVSLESDRLLLRPFHPHDAPRMAQLANDPRIARGTLNMPYPYTEADAHSFIKMSLEARDRGLWMGNAIERKIDHVLIGGIGLTFYPMHLKAELGYWVGFEYWNGGYMTEAAQCLIDYGFGVLMLNRIYASHFSDNPASGRVMQKCGMAYEGTMHKSFVRLGEFRDTLHYAILRDTWLITHANR